MLIRDEMERRFGDRATIEYVDLSDQGGRAAYEAILSQIQEQGLIYPVTVVDGRPVYDGAVSYPAVLRAVESALGTAA